VSKVTLNFTKSAKAENKNITISKVTLMNGADRVGLFEAIPPPVGYTVEKSCTGFERSDALGTANDAIPNTITGFRCVPVDTFYTYENLAGKDKSHATYFELEASVGGSAKTCKVYLAEDPKSVNDTVWDVKRNYWYDVHLDIIDPGFDSVKLTIISSPWNMADTQKVVIGDAGYEVDSTALPLKLVKNYTSADQAKDAEMLAIDKHSRGASWINLVVTDGTPWELVLPQGVIASADSGKHWTTAGSNLTGTGNDVKHRVYVYRPYVENAEPASGFSFYLYVDGQRMRGFVVQPRDTMPIPTNCYILRPQLTGVPSNETHAYIPLEGVYRYWEDCLLANGDTIPAGNVTAELLWADRAGVVQNVSVPPNVATKREKAYILAEAGAVQGNAVIAMKVNGTIYWSFHLWVTEYNPYEAAGQKLYTATKNIFMDRNLGALVNKDDAAGEVRGLYYQFGRKDPFPRTPDWAAGNSYMNGVNITVASAPAAVTVLRPLVAIPAMLKAPMTFYTSSSWPFLTENAYLWSTYGGNKTAFDPCPEGWRIPEQTASGSTNSPWKDLTDATFPLISTLPQRGRSHPDVGHYPFSGYMTGSGVTSAVTHSYYWTSLSTSGTSAEGLGIDNTSSVSSNSPIDIDRGVSVRCVADLQYLRSASGGGLFGSGAANMIDQIK
jgi:uncharacterized protein (TIGR02145 family)